MRNFAIIPALTLRNYATTSRILISQREISILDIILN